ncbi:MAG TPA: DinB family protein [Candidatus Sulfotelmatobacter sp.]|nr:DinB family protein [Candidatus Sulfotelmatobacter sp.]
MNKLALAATALAFLACGTVSRAAAMLPQAAQSSSGAQSVQPKDTTAPSYDMKAQSLLDLDAQNKKFIQLAEALPQEKFTWRPSPEARSFAEVFLHVSGERYQILALGGATPPAGFNPKDPKTYEESTTDKAKIIAELKKTGEFMDATINAMTNADFAKLLPKLGPDANAGDVVYILVVDCHEHMGQLVAYARENGIVPPWTIAAQKAAKEAAEKKAQDAKMADNEKK